MLYKKIIILFNINTFQLLIKNMNNNLDNLSKNELINIIKNLQDENKKLKSDLHVIKILENNYKKSKEIEINYHEEIFNIIKDDIYMKTLIGPKPTSFDKKSIKFCINELYNTCKSLESFIEDNNIKNRSELIKILKNNRIILDNNKDNMNEDINIITESIKNIIIEDKKNKIQCSYIFLKGKNKNTKCKKYVNDETKKTDKPLCSSHKKVKK